MKLFGKLFFSCVAGALFFGIFFAADWGDYTITKCADTKFSECVIDRIVGQEKSDTGIISTDLDKVDKDEFQNFDEQLKISNTLDSSRYHLESYLEWFAFLGLTAAVILIVYNGIILIFSPLSPDQVTVVRKRLMYIVLGVLMLTGFYFVMKIILSILVQVVVK